jgi:hypothetical protein
MSREPERPADDHEFRRGREGSITAGRRADDRSRSGESAPDPEGMRAAAGVLDARKRELDDRERRLTAGARDRERRLSARESAADQRDRAAAERDRAADQRERLADLREVSALERLLCTDAGVRGDDRRADRHEQPDPRPEPGG